VNWDALQREALQALGHTLYRRAMPLRPRLPDDPLLHALLRAAGRDADDDEAPALCKAWMPMAPLRGDPAAKRALWPRLRALRTTAQRPA
jgi:hypothetical protein